MGCVRALHTQRCARGLLGSWGLPSWQWPALFLRWQLAKLALLRSSLLSALITKQCPIPELQLPIELQTMTRSITVPKHCNARDARSNLLQQLQTFSALPRGYQRLSGNIA